MARDDEQQAMTSERLAELRTRMEAIPGSAFVSTQKELSQTFFDRNELVEAMEVTLAEVERRRAREAALVAVVRAVAEANHHRVGCGQSIVEYLDLPYVSAFQNAARALLASTEAAAGEQAAQGEA